MDIRDATDRELKRLKRMVDREIQRRATLASAGDQADALSRSVLEAQGKQPGDAWVQPTGATDAYPRDWEAAHNGKEWVSTVSGNVWEPGVSGWREKPSDGGVPEFVQPTGQHDAYQTGELVSFKGDVYRSTIDDNVWSPADYPQGWEKQ